MLRVLRQLCPIDPHVLRGEVNSRGEIVREDGTLRIVDLEASPCVEAIQSANLFSKTLLRL